MFKARQKLQPKKFKFEEKRVNKSEENIEIKIPLHAITLFKKKERKKAGVMKVHTSITVWDPFERAPAKSKRSFVAAATKRAQA